MRGHGWAEHRHGGRTGGPWGPGPPGAWGPWTRSAPGFFGFGPPPGFGPGPKARRGDVRAAILDVLAEQPMNGYQVIQQIAERSGGLWKPSPGSVYPTLQQLEDEGLVQARAGEGRRLLELTDAGRAYVQDNAEELADTWRAFERPEADDSGELRPLIGQVMAACWQVTCAGSPQQQAEAGEILAETRRKLYGLLAQGDPR